MKLIQLLGITASKRYPGLANNPNVKVGLDFLQQGILDLVAAFGAALSWDPGSAVILTGLVQTGGSISAGWLLATGANGLEIFYYPGGAIIGSINTYIACNWIPNPTDVAPYQTKLSDGTLVSIHYQDTLQFSYASFPNSGNLGGNPDYNNFNVSKLYNSPWINVASGVGYQNGWTDKGSPYSLVRYRKLGRLIYFSGAMQQAGPNFNTVAFTIPSVWAPINTIALPAPINAGTASCLTIDSSGNVKPAGIGGSSTQFINLDGVCFPID